jgi:hypothetical protein
MNCVFVFGWTVASLAAGAGEGVGKGAVGTAAVPKRPAVPPEVARVLLWRGGDVGSLVQAARKYIRDHGRRGGKNRVKAAAVHFWLGRIYELRTGQGHKPSGQQLIRHLEQYLNRYRRAGGVKREVEALARLGVLFWKRSCKRRLRVGLCFEVRRWRGWGGMQWRKHVHYLKRNPRRVRLARQRLLSAVRAWANRGPPARSVKRICPGAALVKGRLKSGGRAGAAREPNQWAARARFLLAEMHLEPYLRLVLPKNLKVQAMVDKLTRRSAQRVLRWRVRKSGLLAKLRGKYERVLSACVPRWSVAALARMGVLYQDYLMGIEDYFIRPAFMRDRWRYKFQPAGFKRSLRNEAEKAYLACLKMARKYRMAGRWPKLCEKGLNRIDRKKYPLNAELKPRPGHVPAGYSAGSAVTRKKRNSSPGNSAKPR